LSKDDRNQNNIASPRENGGVILRRVPSPLDAMHKFYEEVVGLEVLRRDEGFVFFKIAEGYGGHTQNLALFEATNRIFLEAKSEQLNSDRSTLHHIALNVSLEDFESEKMRLEGLGLKVDATTHEWFHVWRHGATVLPHPERCPEPVEGGNLLEFACYDASVG